MEKVILHSTGCPKCKILKMKLDKKNIPYEENLNVDIDDMIAKGFKSMPILEVIDESGSTFYDFIMANTWVNNK